MRVKFVESRPEAEGIKTFYFRPEKPVRYIAGQFIELYLPHASQDKRGYKRWFTLSSAPSEELLSITTSFSDENGSSFKKTLLNLEKDQELLMASPMGDFVLPKDPTVPMIFVAGGIGCTPYRSILKDLQLRSEKRDIKMIYAVKTPEKAVFSDIFETLRDNYILVPKEPAADWQGVSGQLSGEKIIELAKPTDEHYIYLAGPEPMIETLSGELKKSGINKKHIFTDFFPGYLPI